MKAAVVTIGVVLALTGAFILFMPSESAEDRQIQAAIEADKAREQQPKFKPATADELFALVNEERSKAGVAPLKRDERLNQSAQLKANDMRDNHYYDHVSPSTGRQGYEYISDKMPYVCSVTSENMNKNRGYNSTSERFIKSWMESDSHKNAILSQEYSLSGLAVTTAQDGDTIVVQHFCTVAANKCFDVTSHDYNWDNDIVCNNHDGTQFYTSYSGADAFLAQ